jgi:hypothetical protein
VVIWLGSHVNNTLVNALAVSETTYIKPVVNSFFIHCEIWAENKNSCLGYNKHLWLFFIVSPNNLNLERSKDLFPVFLVQKLFDFVFEFAVEIVKEFILNRFKFSDSLLDHQILIPILNLER